MENNNNFDNEENVQEQDLIAKLASSWSAFSKSERREKFEELPRTDAEELFLSLSTHDQAELIEEASHLEKRSWIRLLAPDDVADLIQAMDVDDKDDILSLLDPQTKREVIALLAYAEDAAGGLMNSRFIRLRPEMSVDQAISYIRIQAKTQVETIYYAYVLDSEQKLLGVVSFRELFQSAPEKKIADLMQTDVVQIPVDLDQEQIGRIFAQQDLLAIPVVDSEGHMKGIVTFDDVATAIQEEATEDIHKLGAVETLDAPYLQTSILEMLRKRGGWLLILFIGQMFTATVMTFFEGELSKAFVLSIFIPLIISSGGNSGSQASTIITRAIALQEVRLRDWWRVLTREIMTGACLGLLLGLIGMIRILVWPNKEVIYTQHYLQVSLTVAASVIGVVMWGTISGAMLPFILKKVGFDPASASAPAVATIVDVTGLVIYFTMASLFLAGTLL